jgi:hypothetical protein
MSGDWHHLFSGSFAERVSHLGGEKWAYLIQDLMDSTSEEGEFSTDRLISFVFDRDDGESVGRGEQRTEEQGEEEEEEGGTLGPRGRRLLEIAREVGADSCVRRLQGWLDGTWSPPG